MGPCVWIVGRCGKRKTENFRRAVQSRGVNVAQCRNLGDLVEHLSREHFPTLLVCGPDIADIDEDSGPHLPVFRSGDPLTTGYLTAYAECEAWLRRGGGTRREEPEDPPSRGKDPV